MIEKLKEKISEYESLCKAGRADSQDGHVLLKIIQKTMKKIGLEYCTVNLIKLGSVRYKKFEKTLNCSKWIMREDK